MTLTKSLKYDGSPITLLSTSTFVTSSTVGFSGISIFTVEESVLFTASKSFMPVIIYTAAIAPTIKTEIIQIKRKVLRLYLFFALRAFFLPFSSALKPALIHGPFAFDILTAV